MAKGSPIVSVRIPPLLLAMIDKTVERLNKRRKAAPLVRSTFILNCVLDKFDHLERSLRSQGKRRARTNKATIGPHQEALDDMFQPGKNPEPF